MVGDDAVVADMRVRHDQIVITDGGFGAILHGAAMNGDTLANHIVIADHQSSRLALVLQVRRIFAYRGELIDAIVPTDTGRPFDDHVRRDHRTLADFDIRTNDRPGPHLDVIRQPSGRIDDGARVDQTHISCSAQMISAEQTGLPSTVARQSNFQIPRLLLRKSASRTSWSPGRTGWRNRSLSEPTK